MRYWNQERVDEFMQNVATGFQSRSLADVAVDLGVVLAVVILYFVVFRVVQNRLRRSREERSRDAFAGQAVKLKLTPRERSLLHELSEFLDRPDEELHLLLSDRDRFRRTSELLRATTDDPERYGRDLLALGVRLGFHRRDAGHILRSSSDLPEGTLLFGNDGEPLLRVARVEPGHISARLIDANRFEEFAQASGGELEFVVKRSEGLYSLRTTWLGRDPHHEDRIILEHRQDHNLKRRQLRRYVRRELGVPVEWNGIPGRTVDLGGGGARIRLDRSAGADKADDGRLKIFLDDGHRRPVSLDCEARVVAVTSDHMHLEFTRIREADRDRIIRLIFGDIRRERNERSRGDGVIAVLLFGLACAFIAVPSQSAHGQSPEIRRGLSGEALGDYYYDREEFDLARIEYERGMLRGGARENEYRAKLGLSLMREHRFRDSLPIMNDGRDFSHLYLSMFASFRAGWAFQGLSKQALILDSNAFSEEQKDQARLLGGTVYLEEGDYEKSRRYYTQLQRDSNIELVRLKAGELLTALDEYESLDQKSPWLAGTFSAVLPGSGQIYAGHYADGATAFFFNAMFLGSAVVMYDLENRAGSGHVASGIFGVVGLMFYLANVGGAYQTAVRYNVYQERKFHEDIRDSFFHLDYIQKTSGVSFQTNF